MVKCSLCNNNEGEEKIFLYQNSLRRETICKECETSLRVANKV